MRQNKFLIVLAAGQSILPFRPRFRGQMRQVENFGPRRYPLPIGQRSGISMADGDIESFAIAFY